MCVVGCVCCMYTGLVRYVFEYVCVWGNDVYELLEVVVMELLGGADWSCVCAFDCAAVVVIAVLTVLSTLDFNFT